MSTTTTVSLTDQVKARFPQPVLGTHHYLGDETVVLRREGLVEVCRFLRDDPSMAMDFLIDLSCVDYHKFGKRVPENKPGLVTPSPLPYFMKPKPTREAWQRIAGPEDRFEVVYHFYSTVKNHRLRLKVPVTQADAAVDSITSLWRAADWFEREVWDMFGVTFRGHPNLRRLLMYEGFQGHPLRKDYPYYKRQPIIGPQN
jgi:NADH-quinone oxidoreductase subunit C